MVVGGSEDVEGGIVVVEDGSDVIEVDGGSVVVELRLGELELTELDEPGVVEAPFEVVWFAEDMMRACYDPRGWVWLPLQMPNSQNKAKRGRGDGAREASESSRGDWIE